MRSNLKSYFEGSIPDTLSSITSLINNIENDSSLEFKSEISIQFIRNFTIEGIEPYLKYNLYKAGLASEISYGGYDTVYQDLISQDTSGNPTDIIVLSLLINQFEPDYELSNWKTEDLSDRILGLLNLAKETVNSLVIVNTFIIPQYDGYGFRSNSNLDSLSSKIEAVNNTTKSFIRENSDKFVLFDFGRFCEQVGVEASFDWKMGYLSQSFFLGGFLKVYAEQIARVSRALKGQTKKCIVLDCDNTLWGGIIGEDGIDGIKLDRNSYPGKVFYDFQKSVLNLFNRGVLVAICSKNNEEDVWEVLSKHPHSLLKKENLSAYRINWDDKAQNIVEIANELNIGLDSFIFVDDSEVECERIKQSLTEVEVLKVPKKLFLYSQLLFKDGWFDSLSHSEEDNKRTLMYQSEIQRNRSIKKFQNIDDYLKSLKLLINVHLITEKEIPRVSQLTQKTNQFNLTTRRYSEAKIQTTMGNINNDIYTLSVSDKFGNSGLTGVLIVNKEEGCARIDTLLLSCRVLGRKVEFEFVRQCFGMIEKRWNPDIWSAEYIPTAKNQQVESFWENFKFSIKETKNGWKRYQAITNELSFSEIPYIKIISE